MSTTEFEKVRLEVRGAVGIVTLNDPDTLNSVGSSMLRGLNAALDFIENKDNGIRCVVLTGAGRGFCSGANLTDEAFGGGDPEEGADLGIVLEYGHHPLVQRLQALPVPMVSAVNGVAAGIGMSYALMGDMVLMSKSGYFLQAFRRIGLVPDGGSTWLLPRVIGLARAKELSLMGEKLSAEKALAWGLINRVCEQDGALMTDAVSLAEDLAQGPTAALGFMRELYAQSFHHSFAEQLQMEREKQREAGLTQDFREGVAAFKEKRTPKFTGE